MSGGRKKSPAPAPQPVAAARRARVTSAFVGVTWHKLAVRWRAEIQHDGTKHHLGSVDGEQVAARACGSAAAAAGG